MADTNSDNIIDTIGTARDGFTTNVEDWPPNVEIGARQTITDIGAFGVGIAGREQTGRYC